MFLLVCQQTLAEPEEVFRSQAIVFAELSLAIVELIIHGERFELSKVQMLRTLVIHSTDNVRTVAVGEMSDSDTMSPRVRNGSLCAARAAELAAAAICSTFRTKSINQKQLPSSHTQRYVARNPSDTVPLTLYSGYTVIGVDEHNGSGRQ